ncbi:nitroreductase family protein [Tuberibacillus sp. Marseille-P3662]|uniref:nitroreductase family protein n=1 Tax=Tuberibacillus sp. Marseille-P3662 TaxID=1965358 RepID=UPI000A1CB98D|nr:nitroreductase [Tuberibacillus sp. Marseille-P3662]
MDVNEAIKTRRSVRKVSDKVPDRETINSILESGRWAPNHFKTEPYHFEVLIGEGRQKLGNVYGNINIEQLQNPTDQTKEQVYGRGMEKAYRAPVVIVVKVEPSDREQVVFLEEIASTSCAVQNMLLTIHNLGLGAIWRTGQPSYHEKMKEAFNVSENGLVLGYIYLGYPVDESDPPKKRSLNDVVTWTENATRQ